MHGSATRHMVELDVDQPIWSNFHWVAPLVLVGTREPDGGVDLAPKHMCTPLGWSNWFAFACSPRHGTQVNAVRTGEFTVSVLAPGQILDATFSAAARGQDGTKPSLAALRTTPARVVDGELVEGALIWLECELDRVFDGYGENSLIIGRIVAASVAQGAQRTPDGDDADVLAGEPALAYLHPGRFAAIKETLSFPYPADFRR